MERLDRHGAPRWRRLFGIQRGEGGAGGRPPQGADREVQPATAGVRGQAESVPTGQAGPGLRGTSRRFAHAAEAPVYETVLTGVGVCAV